MPSLNAGYLNSIKNTSIEKLYFKDNKYAYFGDSQDLQLYHAGNHSYIKDVGTGRLIIQSSQLCLQDTSGYNHIINNPGADVQLYYDFNNHSTPKIRTTSTGARIDTILNLYGDAGNPGRLRFQEGGAISEIIGTRNSDANSDLQFKTERGDGTQVRAKINYSGDFVVPSNKVGIGTDSPDSKLHLLGQGNENITLKLEPGTTAGNYSELVIGRTSSAPAIQTTPVVKGGVPVSGVPGILFGSENTNLPAIGFQTPNSSNGHIVFKPKGSEKLRITSDGYLGINETSPIHPLSITINTSTAWDSTIKSLFVVLDIFLVESHAVGELIPTDS